MGRTWRRIFTWSPSRHEASDDEESVGTEEEAEEAGMSPGANGRPSQAFARRSGSPLRQLHYAHAQQQARSPQTRSPTLSPPPTHPLHRQASRGPVARQIALEQAETGEHARQQQLAYKLAIEQSTLSAIEHLPEGVLASSSFECALCLEDVEEGMHARQLNCGHAYHTECIDRWLCEEQIGQRRRCPLCNADPISGVAEPELPTGSPIGGGRAGGAAGSGGAPASSGILFGGVPIEALLPRWALESIAVGESAAEHRHAQQAMLLSA